jgi:hypothetical protein
MTHTKGKMETGGALEQNYIYVGGWHLGCISSADDCNGNDDFLDDSEAVANARRITASWNALEGFDIAAIEAGVVKELLSAAEDLVDFCNTNKTGDALWCVSQLRRAIALIAPSQELQEQL